MLSKLVFVALAACAYAEDGDKAKEDVGTVIGIDLGTTYSWCVSSHSHVPNAAIILVGVLGVL